MVEDWLANAYDGLSRREFLAKVGIAGVGLAGFALSATPVAGNVIATSADGLVAADGTVLSGGFAVPVYERAMERITDDTSMLRKFDEGMGSRRWVDYFVKVVMDFRRALDYLETRPDIDGNKLALYGFSEGGVWSPILLTVEASRIKVAVNHLSGLNRAPYMPVADPFNYVQRVKVPVLMLNGVYDTNLTLKEEVEPMYRLVGLVVTSRTS